VERRPAGRDVYAYFDNDVKTHAPFDAMTLAHQLGLGAAAPSGPVPGVGKPEAVRTSWAAWERTRASEPTPSRRRRSKKTSSSPSTRNRKTNTKGTA
jgi:hypothetical protein